MVKWLNFSIWTSDVLWHLKQMLLLKAGKNYKFQLYYDVMETEQ